MPAQSNVSICNLGLTMLASSRINSMTEDSENARKCNAIFDFVRRELISRHNWNFALKESSLAQLSTTPTTEDWSYIYQLPVDCLRVAHHEGQYDYKIFEDTLYSNESSCKIQYMADITDAAKFTASFAKALGLRIGADLAYGITKNASLAERAEKKAMIALKEAIWSDAQEGQGITAIGSSLITARQTGAI